MIKYNIFILYNFCLQVRANVSVGEIIDKVFENGASTLGKLYRQTLAKDSVQILLQILGCIQQ